MRASNETQIAVGGIAEAPRHALAEIFVKGVKALFFR
jgi:hypothetical protein